MSSDKSTLSTTMSFSFDLATAELEYGRLIKFIQNLPQPTKSHITGFLYPFYVYLYIYLMSEDKVSDALKFLSDYAEPFLKADGYKNATKSLFEFKTLQDILNHSYFKRFCESKFVVKASKDSLLQFTTFLQETQSEVLLPILFSHFHVEDISNNHPVSDPKDYVAEKDSSSSGTNQEKTTSLQKALKASAETKKNIKKICNNFYNITDGQKRVCSADINKKVSLLACGFHDSSVHLWNLDPDSMSSNIGNSDTSENGDKTMFCSKPDKILHGHDGAVYGSTFTSKNELLLTCSEDRTARAWDLGKCENVATYSGHRRTVWDMAVSHDTAYFATASEDLTASLWCFERSKPIRIFAGHSADVDSVKFHSNNMYIASGSSDKTIRLWTVKDARSVRHLTGHSNGITCIAFAPNGHQLASADNSGCIKIWDLGSGQQISEIQAHRENILSIAYSRDGSFLASGGFDKYLKVWNTQCCTAIKNGCQNYTSIELYDSTPTDSIFHFVKFRKRDLLLSVATDWKKT